MVLGLGLGLPLVGRPGSRDFPELSTCPLSVRLVPRLDLAGLWAEPGPQGLWDWFLPTAGWSLVLESLAARPYEF